MNKSQVDEIVEKIAPSFRDTRTKEDKMAEVNAILRMVAEKKGCKVSDLEWRKDRFGAIHVRKRDAM